MTENTDTSANKRNVWVRGFFMLLMVFVFQVSATLMLAVTVIQFVMMLLNGTANARLISQPRGIFSADRQFYDLCQRRNTFSI
jgi:hypothetical protein